MLTGRRLICVFGLFLAFMDQDDARSFLHRRDLEDRLEV
jgi:hypothetical protein